MIPIIGNFYEYQNYKKDLKKHIKLCEPLIYKQLDIMEINKHQFMLFEKKNIIIKNCDFPFITKNFSPKNLKKFQNFLKENNLKNSQNEFNS